MKILIRSTVSFVLASLLIGCTQELLVKSIVLLILLSTIIKCTLAIVSTPYLPSYTYSAEAPLPTANYRLSDWAGNVYRPKIGPTAVVDVIDNPYFPNIPSTKYSLG
jgi:hypothetical protein